MLRPCSDIANYSEIREVVSVLFVQFIKPIYEPTEATLYIPVGSKSAYQSKGWSDFSKIEEGEPFETVVGAQPSCLESQRLDFFFSTNITFSLLRSFFSAIVFRLIIATKIHIIIYIKDKNHKKVSKK